MSVTACTVGAGQGEGFSPAAMGSKLLLIVGPGNITIKEVRLHK